jgi:hypothetical protein
MNEINLMSFASDFASLNSMREQIQSMTKFNQLEILKILLKHNVTINENLYGIHINMSELSESVLNELSLYVQYVNAQESYLNNAEQQKEQYKNTFFLKDNKDNNLI